ncbi:hypothetical protein C4D60_Mb03t00760 [Musa balbisiana]|uniref:Uncharacterized protein n=1 Tax=Musa balbisiana TaxID=52838 RepID=A0A4S8J6L2_MUSBA|nr:hypothetical protein C4D60_Mb03t00760 [Musa balbisiana]
MDRHRGDRHGDRSGDRQGDRYGDGGRRTSSRWSSDSPTHQHHRYPRGGGGGGSEGFSSGGGGAGRYHPYRVPQDSPAPPPPTSGGEGFRSGGRGGAGGGGFDPSMQMGGPRRGGFSGRGGPPTGYPMRPGFPAPKVTSVAREPWLQVEHGRLGNPSHHHAPCSQESWPSGALGWLGNPSHLWCPLQPRNLAAEAANLHAKSSLVAFGLPAFDQAERIVTQKSNSTRKWLTLEMQGFIRPIFEEHGDVVEVAFIKDRKTGEQQGAVEDKLFVASLNKQATAKEIEEIFSPYGLVEDVYIMRDSSRQSRGCGFVKFASREMALAALKALNGVYIMRGCDQPLVVRFADPKRPRPSEPRGGPAFGGPGVSPRSEAALVIRPTANLEEPGNGQMPPDAWHSMNTQSLGPPPQLCVLGPTGGPTNGSTLSLSAPLLTEQRFNPAMVSINPAAGQEISPLQKPLMPSQSLPTSLKLNQSQQTPASNTRTLNLQAPMQQLGQLQSAGLTSFNQSLPSQQLPGIGGQPSTSQSLIQQNASSVALQAPLSVQQQAMPAIAQQQFPAPNAAQQLLQHPVQQFPSQLPQMLLQQQAQTLQSSFQSSQQAIIQLQQQLQLMQQQQLSHAAKAQSAWSGSPPTSSIASSTQSAKPSSAVNASPAVPLTCNWTEHTSPEGFKYYYNSITRESRDFNYAQPQATGSVDHSRVQQGIRVAQEWALKNKSAEMGKPPAKKKSSGGKLNDATLKHCKSCDYSSKVFDEDTTIFMDMARDMKEEGNKLFQKREYDRALLKYEKAIKLLPKNHIDVAYLHSNMAACYMQMSPEEYHQAISECNLALQVSPKYSKALLKRAKCFEALNRLELACKDVDLVLSLEPNNLTAMEISKRVKKEMERKGITLDDKTLFPLPEPLTVKEKPKKKKCHKSEEKVVVVEEKHAKVKEEPMKSIKLVLGEDIRCAQIPANCTMLQLREIVVNKFPSLKAVLIKYKDKEGDLVTITTSDELRWADESSEPQGSVRLHIIEVDPEHDPLLVEAKKESSRKLDRSISRNRSIKCDDIKVSSVCVDDWIVQFAQLFKNHVGFSSDAYLNLHELGMKLYSEAMEETVTSDEAQEIFELAEEKFQEMAALALFNWGNVHMSRARKRLFLSENDSKESMLAQVKASYDWAQGEYIKAGQRYDEALKIKPDFCEALLALGLQHFEQAKLSWCYAIGSKADLEKWPSSEVLELFNHAEDNIEKGTEKWEEIEEQRLKELTKANEERILLQKMGLEDYIIELSNDEAAEQAYNMRAQINLLWGTMLYERSVVEFKLGIPMWEECLMAAVEKFNLAGASPTDVAVMIKSHCANETAQEGFGFKIDEIVQAWDEMHDARRWINGVSSFRLEPLLRRRAPKLHHMLEHA